MRYWEISEHLNAGNAYSSWIGNEQLASYISGGQQIENISGFDAFVNDPYLGVMADGKLIGFAEVDRTSHRYPMLKRLEVSQEMKGKGLAKAIIEYYLEIDGTVTSDDTMTNASISFFKKLLSAHHSGIVDNFTGDVYRVEDEGKIVQKENILVLSPEQDNKNTDKNPRGVAVPRPDYVHRFYWIISKSPLLYAPVG